MKRTDYISLGLSIVLNLLILLVIPGLSVETIVDKKIKVGLVSYDNNRSTKMEGTKNSNSKNKNITAEPKKTLPKKETKPVEKKQEPVKKEAAVQKPAKETPAPVKKKPSLSDIAKKISGPEIDVLSGMNNPVITPAREIPKVVPKKTENNEGAFSNNGLAGENIDIVTEDAKIGNEQFMINNDGKLAFNSEEGNDLEFERLLKADGDVEGLPSGYRLGTEDGNIVARWDNSNREPVYPESAQLRGLHGTVKIRMNIDENGNVTSLFLEKGSGVPEINSAIEEIGRTWKIYLSKNGMNVKGDVILEYNFTLKGKN